MFGNNADGKLAVSTDFSHAYSGPVSIRLRTTSFAVAGFNSVGLGSSFKIAEAYMSTHSSGTRTFRAEFHDFRSEHEHSLKWHPSFRLIPKLETW